jgi:DNA-binding GntR family transcriptional regulator
MSTLPADNADESQSAVMVARSEIIGRLQSGLLSPGQRIVTSELAGEIGLSRGPVREALHILAGEGIIELLPNRGARIRPIARKDILDVLTLLMALGGLAIYLGAALMSDPAAKALMRERLDKVAEALKSRNAIRFYHALQEFHSCLHQLVDNVSLRIAFAHLHMDYFNRTLAAMLPGDHWDQFETNYREIGKDLLAGRAEEARAAYQRHMSWAIGLVRDEGND